MTVFVTRPEPDATRTVAALASAELKAIPTPLLDIVIADAAAPPLAKGEALVFTSRNGVRAWSATGGALTAPAYAVGTATAEAASEIGLTVADIGGGDVDTLLPVLMAAPATGFLHIRGRHSRGQLVERLAATGRPARGIPLYEAKAATVLPAPLLDALRAGETPHGPCRIALFSPRTATILLRLLDDCLGRISVPAQIFCLSPAVAAALDKDRFAQVVIASEPTLPAFIDSLRSGST
ncbi:hypothetical protein PB2503_03017 [Parvularcula bermudensis HTCC2503]|uniref:Tetrapyrrole biosynthesis uroporphyrinogen III synthase domain-containing protein n=1 Tax=Parvularcula bermudensis (strain ATCC BAA-594 / HTCC2503 / KCTC 12087) TaxID=314260 RepID=E0TD21_PARBH|nr:uroporphyrinogen-III synthase [Parvularcula bermudensis]ADM08680.1 hypothetical protein PB2503_03017 [Parvularcula bermudensis HTCC2503]